MPDLPDANRVVVDTEKTRIDLTSRPGESRLSHTVEVLC